METIICHNCKGSGEVTIDVGTHTCSNCKGTGRLYQNYYSYTVPFGTDKKLIYDADSKIHDIIRGLERKT